MAEGVQCNNRCSMSALPSAALGLTSSGQCWCCLLWYSVRQELLVSMVTLTLLPKASLALLGGVGGATLLLVQTEEKVVVY